MQEISNSLRQRLKARPEPKVHPDLDLLTAFIEQVLPEAERSQVVQHLADCGYCREIVALSLPEPQPDQVAAAPAPRRTIWWVPAYRWAAVAATVAIAATLVVEKPWKRSSTSLEPAKTVSEDSQGAASQPSSGTIAPAPAANNAPTTESPATGNDALGMATPAPARASRRNDGGAPGLVARDDGAVKAESQNRSGVVLGAIDGLRKAPVMAPAPPPPVTVVQAAPVPATQASTMDAEPDYLNRTILNNQTAETSAKAVPPEAPTPRGASAAQDVGQARKFTPKISAQYLADNKMDVPVVPPQTEAEAAAPSAADSTLAKSGGFKLKSRAREAISKTVTTVKNAASAKSAPSTFFSLAAPASISGSSLTDADHDATRTSPPQVRWRITPEGTLLRSTDVGGWHQVYSESPDIQFRVVQPHGSEVWAGGNHGTLIHSWDGGVDWNKLSVPDSSASDITGISIDGDNVQVKTSNGQTFVSNDHGKTWVPLQQQPQ